MGNRRTNSFHTFQWAPVYVDVEQQHITYPICQTILRIGKLTAQKACACFFYYDYHYAIDMSHISSKLEMPICSLSIHLAMSHVSLASPAMLIAHARACRVCTHSMNRRISRHTAAYTMNLEEQSLHFILLFVYALYATTCQTQFTHLINILLLLLHHRRRLHRK